MTQVVSTLFAVTVNNGPLALMGNTVRHVKWWPELPLLVTVLEGLRLEVACLQQSVQRTCRVSRARSAHGRGPLPVNVSV